MKNNFVWNVFRENWNTKEIEQFNIFEHSGFMKDVCEALKEKNKEAFAEKIKRRLKYYYWGKCEHEVVVTSWPPYIEKDELVSLNSEVEDERKKYGREPYRLNVSLTVAKKIDVYEQVKMNWDVFIDYVWSKREER